MEAFLGAVIVAVLAILGQGFQRRHDAQIRAREKKEDWARQDLVAQRLQERGDAAAARAQEVAVQTQQAAQLLLVNNEAVAAQSRAANTKLDVIHTLVNSNMTAALQDGLDSNRAQLVTLRELISLKVAQGEEPDEETKAMLHALEEKVGKLAANLRDRIQQTEVANAQIFVAKEEVHDPDT